MSLDHHSCAKHKLEKQERNKVTRGRTFVCLFVLRQKINYTEENIYYHRKPERQHNRLILSLFLLV